jgi:hypothetical protein
MVSSRSFAVSISLFAISPCFVLASGTGSVALPQFTFQTMVNDVNDDLDLHEFRSHLDQATDNHLSDYIEKVLVIDLGGSTGGFQGLHLESTVRRIHDRFETDPRAVMQSTFQGTAIFSDADDSSAPNTLMSEDVLHMIVAQALIGDAYWNLMHRFIEDPVLANVDSLDIIIDESVLNDADPLLTDESNKGGVGGAIAVLAIFSTMMCFATTILLYLAYRRYTTDSDPCCSQSKNSDMTDDDDDDIKEDEAFDDEALAANPPQRKKKRRVKPTDKRAPDVPSLDSIMEEGEYEEEMTTVQLDNLILI